MREEMKIEEYQQVDETAHSLTECALSDVSGGAPAVRDATNVVKLPPHDGVVIGQVGNGTIWGK